MKKHLLMTLAAAALLGLTACGSNGSSSSSHATGLTSSSQPQPSSSESSSSSQAPAVFDGGIVDLEVGVAADVDGIVAQILGKGFTLADGKAAVYVYGGTENLKVGDYVHVEGETSNYYGVYEIAKPTVTKKTTSDHTIADIITTATELTEAKISEVFDAIKASAGEGKTPYSVEKQIPYKLTDAVAVENGTNGGAFKVGDSKLLCPHYYLSEHNRTEANRGYKSVFANVKYDVYFYIAGTNSSNNIDIHIYDLAAKYDAVASLDVDKDSVEIIVGGSENVTATILPAGADQSVTWTSANEEIATVKDGAITGVAVGETTVTVTSSADATKTQTIAVKVNPVPAEVEVIDFDFLAYHQANPTVPTGNTDPTRAISIDGKINLGVTATDTNSGKIYVSTNRETQAEEYAEWRMYKSGSAVLTVAPADGYELVSVIAYVGTSNWTAPANRVEESLVIDETTGIASKTAEANFNVSGFKISYKEVSAD